MSDAASVPENIALRGKHAATLPPAIVLMGPTASGKSTLALELAETFGCEIISVDSAQIYRRISVMTVKEKVELAQKGTKEERRILIGDVNKLVSMAVLNCESITMSEIEGFCMMRHLHSDLFQEIASTREWIKKPKIQLALVMNPAVPINITLPLVKFLGMRELRHIMRDRNLPEGVRSSARKILFDKRGG